MELSIYEVMKRIIPNYKENEVKFVTSDRSKHFAFYGSIMIGEFSILSVIYDSSVKKASFIESKSVDDLKEVIHLIKTDEEYDKVTDTMMRKINKYINSINHGKDKESRCRSVRSRNRRVP